MLVNKCEREGEGEREREIEGVKREGAVCDAVKSALIRPLGFVQRFQLHLLFSLRTDKTNCWKKSITED